MRLKPISGSRFPSLPPLPHIGFLLKFYQVAVAMMADACPERVTHVLTAAAVKKAEWARKCQEEKADTTASEVLQSLQIDKFHSGGGGVDREPVARIEQERR